MPSETKAMTEGHGHAVALVAAAHRSIADGAPLPWEQVDEITRGGYVRETLVSLASLAALAAGLLGDGVQFPAADFLDLLAANAAADLVEEDR